MASGEQWAYAPQENYDPEIDLSKMEKGFLDLVDLVKTNTEYALPNNLRQELRNRYQEVVERNPKLVADVVDKLDIQYRSDPDFKAVLSAVLDGDVRLSDEALNDLYYKVRMLGELMIEVEDYLRAEPYLFIALKIEEMMGDMSDPNLLIDLAESIYCNIDPKANKIAPIFEDDSRYKKVSDIKKFLQPFIDKESDNAPMPQEERLNISKDILYKVIASDPRNVDALQLLAEIFMKYAGQYISLVKKVYRKPIRNFSEADINYVSYNFEEARRFASDSAVCEQEDEMEEIDWKLYSEASRQFAVFLVQAGKVQRAMIIFQDLLDKNTDHIATRDSLVAAMMPSIVMWKDIRNEGLENHRKYIGLRDTAIKYLDEIIHYVDPKMAKLANQKDLLMYITAHYNRALILLWEGSVDDAQDKVEIISKVPHPKAKDWAEDLKKHIEYQLQKERENPNKS